MMLGREGGDHMMPKCIKSDCPKLNYGLSKLHITVDSAKQRVTVPC